MIAAPVIFAREYCNLHELYDEPLFSITAVSQIPLDSNIPKRYDDPVPNSAPKPIWHFLAKPKR
jgi:hypothetical protein